MNKTYFSLFSGVGGFDLALNKLGWICVGACEKDKYAKSLYLNKYPLIPMYNNATTLTTESIPKCELLGAGFPC